MNLESYLQGERKKRKRRKKPLTSFERHSLAYRKEFASFCISAGVTETRDIEGKIYANFIRYLKDVKNNSKRTRLDKGYAIAKFLKEHKVPFEPNPWRSYAK